MLARPAESWLSVTQPCRGAVVDLPYPDVLETDMHQGFELGVMLDGEEERHFEGLVMRLVPGDVWLSPAWEAHGRRSVTANALEAVVQFLPEFIGDEMFGDVSCLSLFAVPPAQRPRTANAGMRREVLAVGQELARELQEQPLAWLEGVRLAVLRLLLILCRGWNPEDRAGLQRGIRMNRFSRVMPAVRLVQSEPGRGIPLAEAASACGISASHFGALFRHTMGISFGKFCLRARLAHAAHLLLALDLPVETIAQQAGFVDGSHLHHIFPKYYGCTPARYRERGSVALVPHA
ncbi:MAG: AraC family transcriptional regulator [Armatimonadota bacterium]